MSEDSLNYDWIFKLPVLWRDIVLLKDDVLVFLLCAHSIFNENQAMLGSEDSMEEMTLMLRLLTRVSTDVTVSIWKRWHI